MNRSLKCSPTPSLFFPVSLTLSFSFPCDHLYLANAALTSFLYRLPVSCILLFRPPLLQFRVPGTTVSSRSPISFAGCSLFFIHHSFDILAHPVTHLLSFKRHNQMQNSVQRREEQSQREGTHTREREICSCKFTTCCAPQTPFSSPAPRLPIFPIMQGMREGTLSSATPSSSLSPHLNAKRQEPLTTRRKMHTRTHMLSSS